VAHNDMHKNLITFSAGLILFACTSAFAADNLLDIYQLAQENDPQFKAAQAAHDAALEAKPQSRALLLPTLSFNAQASRQREDIKSSSSAIFSTDTTYATIKGYSLSLNQPLFNTEYFTQLRQADATVGQADAELSAAEQDLIIRVAQSYFDVLAALDNLEFVRAEKNADERQLEQTKQRFDVGLIAITDVHEAQAAYDLAVAQEIEAENQVSSSREALSELTGQLHKELANLTDKMELISPDPTNIDSWSNTALKQNFSLIAEEFAVKAAREEVKLQRSGHYPTIDITANHGYTDIGGGSLGARETEDDTIGVELNLPLFSGGAVNSRVRQAIQLLEQAQDNLEQQRRATLRQSRDAYKNTLAAIKRVKAFNQAVISAQSALDATEAGLEVGTRTTVDVLNSRQELFLARQNYARSRYDYLLNTLKLKQAAGILGAADLENINSWIE
jgi:outer membrane protein